MIQYLKISLPTKLGKALTYSINTERAALDLIGCRVLVSVQNRVMTGFVTDTSKADSGFQIKPIIKLMDHEPLISSKLLDLAKWISTYYLCDLGMVLKAMVPPELSAKKRFKIKAKKELTFMDLGKFRKNTKKYKIIEYFIENKRTIQIGSLEKKIEIKDSKKPLEELESDGFIELIDSIEEESPFKYEDYISFNYDLFENGLEFKSRSKYQNNLVDYFLAQKSLNGSQVQKQDLIQRAGSNQAAVKKLLEQGIIELHKKKVDRSLDSINELFSGKSDLSFEPNSQQMLSIDSICDSIFENKFSPHLLHGVTGSGKTLVYMYSIRECIEAGKSALILLPEISLTNQIIDRFEKAFPGEVYTYHSMMSPGARKDTFENVKAGNVKVLIGTRSAVFAPLKDLGLIIVDEEHDRSFKQVSPDPKYHARDIAIVRAQKEDCTVVLGSATPSLESYQNAKDGKYNLLELSERVDNASFPDVKVIDILNAKKTAQVKGIFSRELLNAIEDRVAKKEQVILFINRRGFSSFLECTNCGSIPMCKRCDVALTYHKHKNRLYCHYCGFNTHTDLKCGDCGTPGMKLLGMGTQKVEEELHQHSFDSNYDLKIARVDSDTIKSQTKLNKILSDFSKGEFDVMVGTQMITKGLDFKKVTLVGIINADLELYQADFRASERTYQLLEQVSGRAGRNKEFKGEVIIQSNHPDNFALKYVKNHDYHSFFDFESDNRKGAEWPPYFRYASILISSSSEIQVNDAANFIYSEMRFDPKELIVHKPTIPAIERLRGEHRRMIIIKSNKEIDKSGNAIRRTMNDLYSRSVISSNMGNLRVSFDMDA